MSVALREKCLTSAYSLSWHMERRHWLWRTKSIKKIQVMQRAMERSMLEILLRDRVPNSTIHLRTRLIYVVERIAFLKWNWGGHIAWTSDGRWTKRILEWRPREEAFPSKGRPPTRWSDDIKHIISNRIQAAQNRTNWRILREAWVQQ